MEIGYNVYIKLMYISQLCKYHGYVIRRFSLSCETSVEHPSNEATNVRPVGSNNNIGERRGE